MKPPRPDPRRLDADLENYLREPPKIRSERPPAQQAFYREQMAINVVAKRLQEKARLEREQQEEIAAFERQAETRRKATSIRMGRVSDSGLHMITPLDVERASRKAIQQLQIENDALKERERQKDRHKLYTDVFKFIVCLLIGGAGTLLLRLIRLH